MVRRPALGRGLAALLGEGAENGASLEAQATVAATVSFDARGITDLPVGVIRRNPRQPRRALEAAALDELATSIASVGVVQPVIVRQVEGGYELIAGERRWRAAQKAGYTVIPAIVRNASDVESLELALVENVVRQQLNPVDEAYALKVLQEDLGVTQENLAARVGKSRSAIANKIRLLELPAGIQDSLSSGALSEGHGRALLGLTERGKQLQLARRAVERGMSVRQVEAEVRRLTEGRGARTDRKATTLDPELIDRAREAFFNCLGVVPRVKERGTGGIVEVPFGDEEELRRLLTRLLA
jgi:ParB family chromosome partitioning protein